MLVLCNNAITFFYFFINKKVHKCINKCVQWDIMKNIKRIVGSIENCEIKDVLESSIQDLYSEIQKKFNRRIYYV